MNKKVKLFVMDVDGTLTDGKIYMGIKGEIMKAFNAHDAVGVRALNKIGFKTAIITGRNSKIVNNRAKEMNIDYVYQGVIDKLKTLQSIIDKLDIKFDEVAFVGDDRNDLEVMKKCGVRCCPADAMKEIKDIADYISSYKAGDGAVRDIIDNYILNQDN